MMFSIDIFGYDKANYYYHHHYFISIFAFVYDD